MTFQQLRQQITLALTENHCPDARSVVTYLVCDTMNWTTAQMLMHDADIVSSEIISTLSNATNLLVKDVPLQYVTHKAYFCGHTFYVDNNVLIPRPETEQLVGLAIEKAPQGTLLDIGTGSGCIALSIKMARPDIDVSAIDVSEDALAVAQKNMQQHGIEVTFSHVDILSHNIHLGTFDTIVSNPPYICHKEKAQMHRNVLCYEPHTALFVPDEDPLLFYRIIAKLGCEGLLSDNGLLLFEINEAYSNEVMQMMLDEGYTSVERHKDIYGKWRICEGRWKE